MIFLLGASPYLNILSLCQVEAMERRIIANEKQRQMERQRDLNAAQAASENGANGDVSDVEPSSASVRPFTTLPPCPLHLNFHMIVYTIMYTPGAMPLESTSPS